MSDEIFTPFTPAAPPLPQVETPTKTSTKTTRTRKAAEPKAKRKRVVKAAVTDPQAAVPTPQASPTSRKKRKPRAVASVRKPRSMKLPVDTMLAALSGLKGDDGALFEKLLGILNAAGKPQRSRVMAALTKVFS